MSEFVENTGLKPNFRIAKLSFSTIFASLFLRELMSKVKYRYNPDTLNYDQVEVGSKERFLRFTIMAGIVIILTTIATFLVTSFIEARATAYGASRAN